MDDTYVPGLNREKSGREFPAEVKQPSRTTETPYQSNSTVSEGETPVVGFMYSLSRGGEPEWWPLHIGQNKIGKDADMDICLSEGSISAHHANINIKRMRRSGNALSASIVDVGSKNGIILNDEELDYEPHTIHNEDIVIFGLNYKCAIILIDPTKYGLTENPDFVPLSAPKTTSKAFENNATEVGPQPGFPAPGIDPFEGFNDNSTINISGGGIDLDGGATKIL